MKQLKNSEVILRYEEDTKTLIGIEFLDGKATTIDLNEVAGTDTLKKIAMDKALFWPFSWPHGSRATPHIILPKGVTTIEPQTFRQSNIEEITWPDECHIIPRECFRNSSISKLHNIDHVECVEQGAFMSCCHLASFDWPTTNNCTNIPSQCFEECNNLVEINNIDKVVTVGARAFYKCGIKTFDWPKRAKIISSMCFEYSELEQIHGIEEVEVIGFGAFSRCSNLKQFSWPRNCRNISSWCFEGCRKLSEVYGLENIGAIGSYAFRKSGLKRLDLSGSSCYLIDEFAFANSEIEKFVPGYYTVVGKGAFSETVLE